MTDADRIAAAVAILEDYCREGYAHFAPAQALAVLKGEDVDLVAIAKADAKAQTMS